MLTLTTCYSNAKARKMQENKLRVKKLKASIRDYSYIAVCFLIAISVIGNLDIKISPRTNIAQAKEPEIVKEIVRERFVDAPDSRVLKLRGYLQSKNSPLAPYSELIVSESDKYGLDWTRVVAIACMESACGIKLPDGSHNAWGLGGSKFMRFATWEEGIQRASYELGTNYKRQENQGIKEKYCPSSAGCNSSWAVIVTKFSNEILALESE